MNAAVASGSSITNIQRELNKLNSFLGSTVNSAYNATPTWTNNDVGASTDSVKLRADLLTERFDGTTGHTHNGTDSNGPAISASVLADYNDYWADLQTTTFDGALGLSDDITASMTGETSGGGASTEGVVTSAPYNRCEIRDKLAGDKIETGTGELVYGRITESAGTWTLTYYYTDSSGVEQTHSLASQNIRIYYREVFSSANRPTFSSDAAFIDSLDLTADITDATATQPGKVSIAAQTFGGEKTFQDGAVFDKAVSLTRLDQASGGTLIALASTHSFVKLTGASTTELQGIVGPSTAKRILIYNNSSGDLTVKHENAGATAVNRIITTDALDLTVSQFGSVELIYDTAQSRWLVATTAGSGGGRAVQESIGTGDGVTTSFGPLSFTPTDEDSILVLIDGVAEDESLWAYSGGNIVFTTAPAAAQKIYVFYMTDGSSTPLPSPSGIWKVEQRTISAGEATAKQITLVNTPASAADVLVDVIHGSAQEYSVDYTITGAVLDWNGLALDGLLAAGDKLRVAYVY